MNQIHPLPGRANCADIIQNGQSDQILKQKVAQNLTKVTQKVATTV